LFVKVAHVPVLQSASAQHAAPKSIDAGAAAPLVLSHSAVDSSPQWMSPIEESAAKKNAEHSRRILEGLMAVYNTTPYNRAQAEVAPLSYE
jgi:hypothetical protein